MAQVGNTCYRITNLQQQRHYYFGKNKLAVNDNILILETELGMERIDLSRVWRLPLSRPPDPEPYDVYRYQVMLENVHGHSFTAFAKTYEEKQALAEAVTTFLHNQ